MDARAQLLLGLAAWVALALALRGVSRVLRAQALVVVVVATGAEVLGSIVWGVYTYRLENLPSFVPPSHGLVYLAGAALAGAARGRVSQAVLVRGALALVLLWGLAGVTVLPRLDVGGAFGCRAPRRLPRPRPRAGRLRGRLPRRRMARALRHRARHVDLGGGDPGDRRPAGQPAERRRLGLRLVRHRRAGGRAAAAGRVGARVGAPARAAAGRQVTVCYVASRGSLGSEKPILCGGSAGLSVSWRTAPSGTISSCGSPSSDCGTSVRKP